MASLDHTLRRDSEHLRCPSAVKKICADSCKVVTIKAMAVNMRATSTTMNSESPMVVELSKFGSIEFELRFHDTQIVNVRVQSA